MYVQPCEYQGNKGAHGACRKATRHSSHAVVACVVITIWIAALIAAA
jgi:hypothetical protein